MIEEEATVISCDGEEAYVQVNKTTGCNSCQANGACGTSSLAKMFNYKAPEISVENKIKARPGDQVIVSIQDQAMVKGSFLLYMLPLLSMFAFAIVAGGLAKFIGSESIELINTVAGLSGLAVGLWLVNRLSQRFVENNERPKISRIIHKPLHQVSISQLSNQGN